MNFEIIFQKHKILDKLDKWISIVSSSHTTQRTPYVLGGFINFEQ